MTGRVFVFHTVCASGAFSGHADKNELHAWAAEVTGNRRGIFVVHGEEPAATTFAADPRQMHPQARVLVPQFQGSAEL
jgi:metallo-beta-lactamase family protein